MSSGLFGLHPSFLSCGLSLALDRIIADDGVDREHYF
jgi:hypothetical protein